MNIVKDHLGNQFKSITEMCKYHNIGRTTFLMRIRNGMSLEDALNNKKYRGGSCADHLGNQFENIKSMCEHWNIPYYLYISRRNSGYSIEDALRQPSYKIEIKECNDHLGNRYNSIGEMCKYWGISRQTFINRLEHGKSLEQALTEKVRYRKTKICYDHLGNKFNSSIEMCRYWNINYKTFRSRINAGVNLDDALTIGYRHNKEKERVSDHLGNEFNYLSEMCKYWNTSTSTFKYRIRLGLSLEEALTSKKVINGKIHKCIDHLGNEFETIKDMCDNWGISVVTYHNRMNKGLSIEDTLTIKRLPHKNSIKCEDHLGNQFDTITSMCNYWNICRCTFLTRKKLGWNIKDCLTKEVISKRRKNRSVGNGKGNDNISTSS